MNHHRSNDAIWDDYVEAQFEAKVRRESIIVVIALLGECWAKQRDPTVSESDRSTLALWVPLMQEFFADWCLDMRAYPLAASVMRGVIKSCPWDLDAWRVLIRALLHEDREALPDALNSCPRDFTVRRDYDFGALVLDVRDQLGPLAAKIAPALIAEAEESVRSGPKTSAWNLRQGAGICS
ncbi:MAG: hypothetical protein KF774_14150, partial [Planctomyces sp.]|nr:hypothetical protein [Planctomyces sp.]